MAAEPTFEEILERLSHPAGGTCTFPVAAAGFDDEAAGDNLDARYREAVRILTAAHGPPSGRPRRFPEQDVEKAVFWEVGERIVHVRIDLEDNTRCRRLVIGACPPHHLRVEADWWDKEPW